jgi:hypothetical protein
MIFHPVRWVWPVGAGLALLVCLLALAGAGPAQAQQGPPVLPGCPETSSTYLLFPSPFFDEDQTMFWVYQDASRAGVVRSTDNGRTWFEVLSYSEDRRSPWINQFDIASMRSGSGLAVYTVVYVPWAPLSPDEHFFASENSGSTWQEGSSPCAGYDCYYYSLRAASRPGVLFQPRVWWSNVGTGLPEGVARSVDHGATWQQVWGQTGVAQVAISPNFDQDETLVGVLPYSGITNSNIIISHDAGETWRLGGDGLCPAYWFPQLTISPGFARDGTLLLASDRSSLFMSEDGGLTWRAIFPPGGPFCDTSTGYGLVYAAFSPDYPDDPTIYAATYRGLYASYDAGRSWILLVGNSSSNLIVRRVPDAGRSPTERTTSADVSATENGHRVFLPLAAVQGSGPPYKPHTLFMRATVTGSYNGAHYRSDDGGRTWQCMTPPGVRTRSYLPLLRIRW